MGRNPSSMSSRDLVEQVIKANLDRINSENARLQKENLELRRQANQYPTYQPQEIPYQE